MNRVEIRNQQTYLSMCELYGNEIVKVEVGTRRVPTGYCSFTFENIYEHYPLKDLPERYKYWSKPITYNEKTQQWFVRYNKDDYNPAVYGWT